MTVTSGAGRSRLKAGEAQSRTEAPERCGREAALATSPGTESFVRCYEGAYLNPLPAGEPVVGWKCSF